MFLATTLLVMSTVATGFAQDRGAVVSKDAFANESTETSPRRVLDKKFWTVAAVLNTAMVLDTKSTFDVVRACESCREANPLVAPFIRRGPAVTFTAGEFFDAGVMTVAARMKAANRPWVRRTWWAVPAALVAGHAIAQHHNLNLLR